MLASRLLLIPLTFTLIAAPSSRADDPPLVGIGVQLKQEADDDGKELPSVVAVLPNGAAGKDGRLKEGDTIVGVVNDEKETIEFEGKTLMEVVGFIRGPIDTKVRLVVVPKGSKDRKVYELVRAPIEVVEKQMP